MKAEQINNFILFLYNLAFFLIMCVFALLIVLMFSVAISFFLQKLNGDKVYISPIERSLADREFCKIQLIIPKINGEVVEIEVSKKLVKWAFRSRFNYWLFIKYILFKAQMGGKW